MKIASRILLLFMLPLASLAQDDQHFLDSMETALRDAANDTIRLEINRQLGFYFQDGAADIGLVYHQAQLELAKKLNLRLWEADAYQQVAYCYSRIDNLPAAYESYMKGFKIARDPSSSKNGWGYQNFSYSESPDDARQSIIGMIHFEISGLYARSRSYDEQRYHLFEAIKIGEKLQNKKILSLATRDIGLDYFNNNQPDSAFKYYTKALDYYKDSPYQTQSAVILEFLSQYYLQEQKIDSALFYLRKALRISIEDNKIGSIAAVQLALGSLFKETGQVDSAFYYTSECIETARSINNPQGVGLGKIQLASIYRLQDKNMLAYDELESGKMLLDSINDAYITRLVKFQNIDFDQKIRVQELEKEKEQTESRIRMYALLVGLGIFLLVALLLYRNNRQKQKANKVLENTLADLKMTQDQLVQQEKLANLGQLTAGIAHEIKNPLNFVINFSEVSKELIDEAFDELKELEDSEAKEEVIAILNDVRDNLTKVHEHGSRADGIVKSMLQHSRGGSGKMEPTNLNALVQEYVNLAFHGMRANKNPINVKLEFDLDENLGQVNVIGEDFSRVVLNLSNNAFDAMREKAKTDPEYSPVLAVKTQRSTKDEIRITITDNGLGIPDDIKDKVLQPFFTTKKGTDGTGLGLSITNDIVKAHGGEMDIVSSPGTGTTFSIHLSTKLP